MRRCLLAACLLLAPPAYALELDLGSLGGSLGIDSGSMRHIERGLNVAKALIPISDAEERKLGRAVAARVIGRFGLERGAAPTRYLSLIGTALAQRSDRPDIPYRFAILASDDVNAYACPGGYIFVTRGALQMVADEAELAAVLAHEIAHVSERHIIKALQQSKLMQVGAEAAAEAFAHGGHLFEQMTDFAVDSLFKGLKKADEYASDEKAMVYLDRLGYDYPAMFDVLTLLDERRKAGQAKVLAETHPSPKDRLSRLKRAIRRLSLGAPTGIRLRQRFDRVAEGEKVTS